MATLNQFTNLPINKNNMQSYTFDQLDERGKSNACELYKNDPLVKDLRSKDHYLSLDSALVQLAWRFTIHGERVA